MSHPHQPRPPVHLTFRVGRDRRRPHDPVHEAPKALHEDYPAAVDLRTRAGEDRWPVWNQGHQLPSCTAHAVAGAALFEMIVAGRSPLFEPSRLFLYYGERVMEVDVEVRADGYIRDGLQVLLDQGVCADGPAPGVPDRAVWPYVEAEFAKKPPAACFAFARHARPKSAKYVSETLPHLRGCLAEGHPFTICIRVFESFGDAAQSGDIPMPTSSEKGTPIGGHAMVVCGYDEEARRFVVRNSTGTGWGRGGYGTLPYDYVLDPELSDSFWTLRYA